MAISIIQMTLLNICSLFNQAFSMRVRTHTHTHPYFSRKRHFPHRWSEIRSASPRLGNNFSICQSQLDINLLTCHAHYTSL